MDEILRLVEALQLAARRETGDPAFGFRGLARFDRQPGFSGPRLAGEAANRNMLPAGPPFRKLPELVLAADKGRGAQVRAQQFDRRRRLGPAGVQLAQCEFAPPRMMVTVFRSPSNCTAVASAATVWVCHAISATRAKRNGRMSQRANLLQQRYLSDTVPGEPQFPASRSKRSPDTGSS